jgi:hypothetical protein
MLPRAEAPARSLPYTTADMSERLAKRKAEQEAAEQAKANQAFRFGITNPPVIKKDEPWYKDALGAVGGAIKSVYDNIPMSNPISTPINMGGDAGVSMGGQGTGKSLVTEPARLAVRRAVGDITAIPRVGADSPSYTADQIRQQGVARGLLGAAIDYSQFIPIVAKGAGFASDAVNAYKLAMMERQANPFPALRGASNVIDVVEGSRLPSRVVDAPAPPATRLAQAQTQRALPPAPTAAELARLQREAARNQLGVNIQDIEFPPQNTLITNPELIDPALEGYEQINPNAWEELGIAQEKSGFNSQQMPEQMESVRRYFSNEYQTIQSYLSQLSSDPNFMNKADLGFDIRDALQEKGLSRNDFADDMRNLVSNMDQAFEVVPPLTKPVVVYRGVNIAESQDLYAIAFYKNLQPGQIIYDPAFSSTSVDKEMASNWAAQGDDKILIIRVPAGTKAINPISSWTYGYTEMDTHVHAPNEKELLLPRNTIFKVMSNNGKYIELEVVQPGSFKGQGLATNVRNAGQKLSKTMSFKEALSKISSEYLQRSIIDKKLAALPQLPNVSMESLMYNGFDLVNNKITKLDKKTERIFKDFAFSLNNGVLPESINKQILFDTFAKPDRPGWNRDDLEIRLSDTSNKLYPKLMQFMNQQQEWMAKNPGEVPQPIFVDWDGKEVKNPIFKLTTFTNPYDGFIANGQAFLFKNSDKNRFIENADSYRRRAPDQYINEIDNVFDHLAKAEVIGDNNVDDLKKLFRKYFYEKFVDVSE